jgi:hypothetical protein
MNSPTTETDAIESPSRSSIEMSSQDCPIDGVMIYQDRAEVTRKLSFTPSQFGEIQILITSITLSAVFSSSHYPFTFPHPMSESRKLSCEKFESLL